MVKYNNGTSRCMLEECPKGYYRPADSKCTKCYKCNDNCETCKNSADDCDRCVKKACKHEGKCEDP